MAAQNCGVQVSQAPTTTRKINSFALWMEAWNAYASILLSAYPACAQELLGYQRLITSANLQLPFSSWMSYDVKFRTLAATCPSLRWDTRHPDLWLEHLTIYQNHQCQNAGPAHIATVYIIFQTVVLFLVVDLQILHPLIDNQLTCEPQGLETASPHKAIIPTQAHCPTFVETSTIKEGVHDHTAAEVSLILTYSHCPTVPLMTPLP